MNKDPFKEYIKESEPAKRDKGYFIHDGMLDMDVVMKKFVEMKIYSS